MAVAGQALFLFPDLVPGTQDNGSLPAPVRTRSTASHSSGPVRRTQRRSGLRPHRVRQSCILSVMSQEDGLPLIAAAPALMPGLRNCAADPSCTARKANAVDDWFEPPDPQTRIPAAASAQAAFIRIDDTSADDTITVTSVGFLSVNVEGEDRGGLAARRCQKSQRFRPVSPVFSPVLLTEAALEFRRGVGPVGNERCPGLPGAARGRHISG
jgi:hypothetical protein